jgi:hypothetical protein
MKVTTLFLALVLGAQTTLIERDLATVRKVFNDITAQTDTLDTAIKAYNGDIAELTSMSDKLVTRIKSGKDTINSETTISINDAIEISPFITSLNSSVATTINDLISKKPAFVSASQAGTILKSLQDQRVASEGLSDVLISKIPLELQGIARQQINGIDDNLAQGIAAFQGSSSNSTGPAAHSSNSTGLAAPAPSSGDKSRLTSGVIAGTVAAIVVVLALGIIAIIIWRKRSGATRNSQKSNLKSSLSSEKDKGPFEMVGEVSREGMVLNEADGQNAVVPELQAHEGHIGRHELESVARVHETDGREMNRTELEAIRARNQ